MRWMPGLTLVWLLSAAGALAHGLTAGQGTLRLDGASAHLTVTPWSTTFREIDTDQDGLLSREELRLGKASVLAQLDAHVGLVDAQGRPGVRTFTDVLVGIDHHSGTSGEFVKLVVKYEWPSPPSGVKLRYELFAGPLDPGMVISAWRASPGTVPTDISSVQQVFLSPTHTHHAISR